MCDCLSKVNEAIREDYEDSEAELQTTLIMKVGSIVVYPLLAASYHKKKKDGSFSKVKSVVGVRPTFCPFCGIRYETAIEQPERSED